MPSSMFSFVVSGARLSELIYIYCINEYCSANGSAAIIVGH